MDDQDMKNKKDLLDALDDPDSLSQEELDAILDDPKELEEKIRERFFGIELFIHRAKNLYHFLEYVDKKNIVSIEKEDFKRGILAWDMGELITLARVALETGYIDEQTAWEYIRFAGEKCRQIFKNWEEIGKSYLIGQAMKTDKKEESTHPS